MVNIFPKTLQDLRKRRPQTPQSEITAYKAFKNLPDQWYVWHSLRWHKNTEAQSGEADYLIFHEEYGFLVAEVKGGIISTRDNMFFTENTETGETFKLDKDPLEQAENFMWHLLNFFREAAKKEKKTQKVMVYSDKHNKYHFPLNYSSFVFFTDSYFKKNIQTIQYRYNQIFDKQNLEDQKEWINDGKNGKSPLESFMIDLLNIHMNTRVLKSGVKEFFLELIGHNISPYINLKEYYQIRNKELEEINQIQDFLLDALAEKKQCIFKGSAGSGKTFIAMKKAIKNYREQKKTLFLCFNRELRENVKSYISKKLDTPLWELELDIDIYSINLFLLKLIAKMFNNKLNLCKRLKNEVKHFNYQNIAEKIKKNAGKIPKQYLYESIIIDEAQDIDYHLWDVFVHFLRDREKSTYYVFFDSSQSIFVENFNPRQFKLEQDSDLIVLNRNLRNSYEITRWIEERTELGEYKQYSGINGFKVSLVQAKSASKALNTVLNIVYKKKLLKQLDQKNIIVLSYYKLSTLYENHGESNLGEYVEIDMNKRTILIEPHNLSDISEIEKKWRTDQIIPFKTISAFKGLERDIVFLVIPDPEDFKGKHPERYENFQKQIYVGASRAKFKLYVVSYKLD
jgi:hypothetical protein